MDILRFCLCSYFTIKNELFIKSSAKSYPGYSGKPKGKKISITEIQSTNTNKISQDKNELFACSLASRFKTHVWAAP